MMYEFRNKYSAFVNGLVLVLAVAITQHAEAQRSGRSGLRLGHVTALQLLALPDVQKELKLSRGHIAKIDAIAESLAEDRGKLFAEVSKESGERGAKLRSMNDMVAAKVAAILDQAQQKRLQEILLQVNGAVSLEDEEVAKKLAIDDDQKSKLAELSRASAKSRREIHKKLDGASSQSLVKELVAQHKATGEKLLEVLTDDQRKQFEEMQGEKIKLDLFQL